jgi:L-aspartate oxidase
MRYICNFSADELDKECYDVVIVGSGIAGLCTALNLNTNLRVAVLSKKNLEENNTFLAQGGVAAAIENDDSPESHAIDTLKAGSWVNNKKAVEILTKEAKENIQAAIKMGANFDRDEQGNILSTMEGGHSRTRILHAGGDATGRELHRALTSAVFSRKNISILEKAFGLDLLVENERCCGILADIEGKRKVLYSRALVLATGGIGQIYSNTSNSIIATGDGIAMAYRAGARLKDMEFVQFHPTTLYSKELKDKYGRYFLISEAVRGEGAVLRNRAGRRFMEGVHPQKDLAPRDIVARTIFQEMSKEGAEYLYLDATHKSKEFLKRRFPTIYATCKEIGLDMSTDYIPIAPAAHYMMGGIEVDLSGRTAIASLYACGECACTGVHGANRLASNSLIEGLVFGRRIALDINKTLPDVAIRFTDVEFSTNNTHQSVDWQNIRKRVGQIMIEKAGIVRSSKGLREAWEYLGDTLNAVESINCNNEYQMETKNMIQVASQIVKAAARRRESCGAHFIID